VPTCLSHDYSLIKVLLALGQLCFAIATLYRTRGDQIEKYGYAAFGLTVIQYALMSLINLLANVCCPQYPTVYMVETAVMREARMHPGAVFEGVVATIDQDPDGDERDEHDGVSSWRRTLTIAWWLPIVWTPTALAIVIIWILSRFRAGESSLTQRAVLMSWLAVGSWVGAGALDFPQESIETAKERQGKLAGFYLHVGRLLFAIPPIWGMVIVGRMLVDYGTCTLLS
jgi:hypothetical protein